MRDPIVVTVDNRVRLSRLPGRDDVTQRIRDAFEHENHGDEGVTVERTWRYDDATESRLSVPRGGMARVRRIMRGAGEPFRVEDLRHDGDFDLLDDDWGGCIPAHRRTLYPFQERVLASLTRRQNTFALGHTGTGKTTVGLALAARINRPTLVIVSMGSLFDQWQERIELELGVDASRIGVIGDGKRFTAPITIAMQQTLARGISTTWLAAFGVVICDEIQLFAAPTFFDAVDPWPARYRVGLSKDESRRDGREYMTHDLFGDEPCDEMTEDEALEQGKVVEVEVRIVPTEFDAPGYRGAMASGNRFQKHAVHRKMINRMTEDAQRNEIVHQIVRDSVRDGEQVMVFSERVDHCLRLDKDFAAMGIQSGTMLGGQKAKQQFRRTRDGINDGSVRVVVGTISAIGTGQDFPSVTVGVLTTPKSNNRQLLNQIKGRLCRTCERTGKRYAILYALWDRAIHGKKAIENLVRWNSLVRVLDDESNWVDGSSYLAGMRGIMVRDLSETPLGDE